ncbi:hypothetical protein [Caldalkalibacillus mannanilyticus]|uniref:hypothetical protein n=1 Tax=Caldalkalibacillus mannanilyticus TaxID=1418 RepID=UPI000468AC6F|nr:hypothetical protein [Caldalkalibacillus mannanilyticus]
MKFKWVPYLVLLIVLIAGSFFLRSTPTYPKWVGESKGKQWLATFEHTKKGRYSGMLQWQGSSEAYFYYYEFYENGKRTSHSGADRERKPIEYAKYFADLGGIPKEGERLELKLVWEEDGTKYEEMIELRKQ